MALMSSEYGFFRNALGALCGVVALSPLILILLFVRLLYSPFEKPKRRSAAKWLATCAAF